MAQLKPHLFCSLSIPDIRQDLILVTVTCDLGFSCDRLLSLRSIQGYLFLAHWGFFWRMKFSGFAHSTFGYGYHEEKRDDLMEGLTFPEIRANLLLDNTQIQ